MEAQSPVGSEVVVVPSGAPLEEAAAWVGAACWTELRFHQLLTTWLADEADGERSVVLWRIRAHRAELAETWHRRLPELREMPRPDFVEPASPAAADRLAALEAAAPSAGPLERLSAAASVLAALGRGYAARAAVAVGPADAPVAESLGRAIEVTGSDAAALAALAPAVDLGADAAGSDPLP